ncbi:type 2 lantipeptide synthetase LanM [Paenibacillus albidus]|uniref:type 2 lanthipeptide synthetase LanM n=1 Tax=Paenibacillus albidus TaxID=2041023 RepID=UPI001BEA2918|nr:type 2 lanthipeptide synthetase LanM [Paenibacillus albidus]MBT2289553.1 type 2 lantipeptide synthetase LanM [Paenibacillus albidus]
MLKEKLAYSLTIHERLKYMNENENGSESNNVKEWLSLKSLVTTDSFGEMLKYNEITEKDFNRAIRKIDPSDLENVYLHYHSQEWVQIYNEILSFYKNMSSITEKTSIDMGYIAHPFILYFEKKLSGYDWRGTDISLTTQAKGKLLSTYIDMIISIYNKVFIIELNKYKETNPLEGNNSFEQLQDYLSKEFDDKRKLQIFYEKYIVCTRIAVVKTTHVINFIFEALDRVIENREKISSFFLKDTSISTVTDINFSVGDSHQEGRSVIIFEFNSTKVVYKPRNLKIAEVYNDFINWINKEQSLLSLKTVRGIYCDHYAFEEFIENKECSEEAQITNYYKRFGYILAISHLLCANDFHLENLIAYGDQPILIDLETIVQSDRQLLYADSSSSLVREDFIFNSILNTALLPTIAFLNKDNKGIYVSALNGNTVKLPYKILAPTNMNTADMKYQYVEYTRPGAHNLPKYLGEKVNFLEYRQIIIAGFTELISFLQLNKNYLLSEESVLSKFNNHVTRIVIKNTDTYVTLLNFSNHPKYCEDMLKREKLLENLWSYPHKNKKVVICEYEDMLYNDIPIFFCNTGSTSLLSSRGVEIPNYFERTGFQKMKERISNLTRDEITKQLSIIKISLGYYDDAVKAGRQSKATIGSELMRLDYLAEARTIANRILEYSYENKMKDQLSWGGGCFQ